MKDNLSTDHAAADGTRRRTWTADEIRGLGAATTLLTAASVLGISRSLAYQLAAAGQFPVPVIRAGARLVVPIQPLLQLLHLDNPAPDAGVTAG